MKEQIGKANDFLTGFRTVLVAIGGWLLLFVDSLIGGLAGFGPDALKGAAVVAGLVTLKQIKTDIIPKLTNRLKK
jgi:hypothetical protein